MQRLQASVVRCRNRRINGRVSNCSIKRVPLRIAEIFESFHQRAGKVNSPQARWNLLRSCQIDQIDSSDFVRSWAMKKDRLDDRISLLVRARVRNFFEKRSFIPEARRHELQAGNIARSRDSGSRIYPCLYDSRITFPPPSLSRCFSLAVLAF